MKKRAMKPIFLVDIAVPRDIDPRIGDIDGAYLYDIDDLQQVVEGNQEQREKESEQARALLKEEAQALLTWLKSLESVPLIRAIQEQAEKMRREELEKASRYMKDLSDEQNEMVERFSRALMKRFMHPTLRTLKTLPDDIEGDLLMGAARRLFDADQALPKQAKESDEQTSG